jgi:hypothetical protein
MAKRRRLRSLELALFVALLLGCASANVESPALPRLMGSGVKEWNEVEHGGVKVRFGLEERRGNCDLLVTVEVPGWDSTSMAEPLEVCPLLADGTPDPKRTIHKPIDMWSGCSHSCSTLLMRINLPWSSDRSATAGFELRVGKLRHSHRWKGS